jgi:hypothetical protein
MSGDNSNPVRKKSSTISMDIRHLPMRNSYKWAEFKAMHITFLTQIYHIHILFSTLFLGSSDIFTFENTDPFNHWCHHTDYIFSSRQKDNLD